MKGVCIIPAKGNSRRLPRKNALPLAGRPMVCRAVDAALGSQRFDLVAVSSNDPEILDLAREAGAQALPRDEALCADDVRAKDVVLAHLREMDRTFDFVALCMATTPLRTAEHVRGAVDAFLASGRDTLASVCEYEFSPALALAVADGALTPYFGGDLAWTREEAHAPAWHLNGAIYLARYAFFMREATFVADGCAAFPMGRLESLDVDTPEDFRLAEACLRMREEGL